MKKLHLISLLFILAFLAMGATTSRFERTFRDSDGTLLTGATIYIVNDSDSLLLTEVNSTTRPGVYRRDAVETDEYKIYVNGDLVTQSYWFGADKLTTIAGNFNSSGELGSSGYENGSIGYTKIDDDMKARIAPGNGYYQPDGVSLEFVIDGSDTTAQIKDEYLDLDGDSAVFKVPVYMKAGPIVDVRAYGALGDSTDQTAKIQSAISSLSTTGGSVYLPAGKYVISDSLGLYDNIRIYGDYGKTRLYLASASYKNMITNVNWTNGNTNIIIEDLWLDGNASGNPTAGQPGEPGMSLITLVNSSKCIVRNIYGQWPAYHGLDICADDYGDGDATVTGTGCSDILVDNCEFYKFGDDGITTHYSKRIKIMNCTTHDSSGTFSASSNGIEVDDGSSDVSIINCYSYNVVSAVQVQGHGDRVALAAENTTINGLHAKNCNYAFYAIYSSPSDPLCGSGVTINNLVSDSCNAAIRTSNYSNIFASNIIVRGKKTAGEGSSMIAVSGDSISNIHISDVDIKNVSGTYTTSIVGDAANLAKNVTLKNVTIDVGARGCHFDYIQDCRIENVTIDSTGTDPVSSNNTGIFASNSESVTITNCSVKNTERGCIRIEGGDNHKVTYNTVENAGATRAGYNGIGIYIKNSSYSLVAYNDISNCESRGIYYHANGSDVYGIDISNNLSYDNGDDGILVTGISGGDGVYNSKFTSNTIFNNDNDGFNLSYNSDNNIITKNIVYGNSQDTDNTSDGIRVELDSDFNKVTDNKVKHSGAAKQQKYGIHIVNSTCDSTEIKNNDVYLAGKTKEINDAGTSTVIIANPGYVTEAKGTATVTNGNTTVVVTHGLDFTPAAGQVYITPVETLNSASYFWVDTYTSTQFTINVNADPGQDVDFAWKISKE